MEEVVQSYVRDKTFMGTVLVARGSDVILSEGYGSANLEWDIPNTAATKFRLGSLTKQFTAASILLLEERGKLTLDDPIKKHVPDAPSAWDTITIFHLLTGQPAFPILAESETLFFYKVVEATLEFQKDASGAVTAVRLRQGSIDSRAPRK